MPTRRVAVVGGGITGAVAASALAPVCEVHVYDQGRRGPGGRASHRTVDPSTLAVLATDAPPPGALEFDHGCQFLRADDARMRTLAAEWVDRGICAAWRGRFGTVGDGASPFFGLPTSAAPVYVGVGGMHRVPRRVLEASGATVHAGVRVSGLRRVAAADGGPPQWALLGVGGAAAFHDTAEAVAAATEAAALGAPFDAVLLTDVSSSFANWHRASAGVPESLAARVRERVRVPLFAAMVAFAEPLGLALDGINFGDGVPVWWASRTQSKPGLESGAAECWTLVSTPAFAVDEITAVPMQDAATGAFRPQEDSYLNSGPAPALLRAFTDAVAHLRPAEAPLPRVVYLQGQRWGSALPAPTDVGGRDATGRGAGTVRVLDVAYERSTPPLTFDRAPAAAGAADYAADEGERLFYAGDFTSRRAPGFEAAALSGLDAASALKRVLGV